MSMKVEPNQELKGLVCNGANVLPTRVVHNAFQDEFGMYFKVSSSFHQKNVLYSGPLSGAQWRVCLYSFKGKIVVLKIEMHSFREGGQYTAP